MNIKLSKQMKQLLEIFKDHEGFSFLEVKTDNNHIKSFHLYNGDYILIEVNNNKQIICLSTRKGLVLSSKNPLEIFYELMNIL